MGRITAIVVLLVVGLMVGLQLLVRSRARAMRGRPLPDLPGATGAALSRAPRALVYFFSPSCRACRPLTPRFEALRGKNPAVFLVDVFQEIELARGLSVMGTPSVVEIAGGIIVGYHVGNVPPEVVARFS